MEEMYELIDYKKHLESILEDTKNLFMQSGYNKEKEALEKEIRIQLDKSTPRIMFYGIYNSGKSSLINAITGKECVKVGDVPTTASIQSIAYEGFTMVDTPGIIANDEHTEIAENEIKRSDIILFVVDDMGTFENKAVAVALVKIILIGKPLLIVINQKNSEGGKAGYSQKVYNVMEKISSNMKIYAKRINCIDIMESSNFVGMVPVNAKRGFDAKVKFADKLEAKQKLLSMSNLSELINLINIELRKSSGVNLLKPAYDILVAEINRIKQKCIAKLSSQQNIEFGKLKSEIQENKQHVLNNLIFKGRNEIEAFENEAFAKMQSRKPIDQAAERMMEQLQNIIINELKNVSNVVQSSLNLHISRFKDMKIDDNIMEMEKWKIDISDLEHNNIFDDFFKLADMKLEMEDSSKMSIAASHFEEGKAKVIAPIVGGAGSVVATGGINLPVVALAYVAGKLFDAKKKQKEMEQRIQKFNEAAEEHVNAMVSQIFELNNKLRIEVNRVEKEYEEVVNKIVEDSFSNILKKVDLKMSISSQEEKELNQQIQWADSILKNLNTKKIRE